MFLILEHCYIVKSLSILTYFERVRFMSKLEDLIAKLCPNGVEYKKIGEIAYYEQPTKYIVKSTKYDNSFATPVLTAGQSFILGYTDELDNIYLASKDNPVIIFDDFTGAIQWVDFPFKVKSSAMKMITAKPNVLIRYLYHWMSLLGFSSSEHKRLWIGTYSNFEIPVPPLEVQAEIVRILDTFTELTAELTAELTTRKKQYEYYRDTLLTFDDNNPLHSLISHYCPNGVEYKKIGDIATDVFRGSGIKKDQVTSTGIPCVRYGEIYTKYNLWFDSCFSHTSESLITNKKYFEHGDILFAITGESVEDIAKSCAYVGNEKCLAGGDIVVVKHNQNPKYLSYALSTTNARLQKSSGKVKSKVVHASTESIKGITIPVPPLDVQRQIVQILDRFDALCNDLTKGLPAEIEARRKQYEYYRDQLLNFKRA